MESKWQKFLKHTMCPPIDHLEHLISHWHPNRKQIRAEPTLPIHIYSCLPPHECQRDFKDRCLVEPRRSPSSPSATLCIEWMANAFSSTAMDAKLVDNCTTQDNGTCLWQGCSPLCVCAFAGPTLLSVSDMLAPACKHLKYKIQSGTMHETNSSPNLIFAGTVFGK
jgi:hypothetical protein